MRVRRPSATLVASTVALFAALGGTAFANSGSVRRALLADKASAISADAVTIRTAQGTIPMGGQPTDFYAGCAKGEKAIKGGFDTDLPPSQYSSGTYLDNIFDMGQNPTGPENFGVETWHVRVVNYSNTADARITVYAVCLAAA